MAAQQQADDLPLSTLTGEELRKKAKENREDNQELQEKIDYDIAYASYNKSTKVKGKKKWKSEKSKVKALATHRTTKFESALCSFIPVTVIDSLEYLALKDPDAANMLYTLGLPATQGGFNIEEWRAIGVSLRDTLVNYVNEKGLQITKCALDHGRDGVQAGTLYHRYYTRVKGRPKTTEDPRAAERREELERQREEEERVRAEEEMRKEKEDAEKLRNLRTGQVETVILSDGTRLGPFPDIQPHEETLEERKQRDLDDLEYIRLRRREPIIFEARNPDGVVAPAVTRINQETADSPSSETSTAGSQNLNRLSSQMDNALQTNSNAGRT